MTLSFVCHYNEWLFSDKLKVHTDFRNKELCRDFKGMAKFKVKSKYVDEFTTQKTIERNYTCHYYKPSLLILYLIIWLSNFPERDFCL